ncbi:hypothetical protein IHE44_0011709 [Lamprotornis superbus]|uniref:Tubulin polyglutamylase complex subunit 2 n=1 Tax=Lamprotornis superbus TaxID=245042 RepID=A0A835NIC2_9PASS|nr:hypothetical protein IHE44_0011709 [Lamprotornis superbus]
METSPGVAEVTFVEKEPAERHTIVSWEQGIKSTPAPENPDDLLGGPKKNSCVLPEDLKNFYLMTDGFQMTWSVKTDDTPMPLGSMVINSVSKLCRLGGSSVYTLPSAPTLADLEDDTDEEGNGDKPEKPHFDSRSLIFELDPCNGNGKVCLVYKHAEPDTEIWFLDRALYWHFLTKTFTAYYRLLITHLGLPQWQYAFTSYGVSPQAKQWFNMYKPITINTALLSEEADSFVNKLDPDKTNAQDQHTREHGLSAFDGCVVFLVVDDQNTQDQHNCCHKLWEQKREKNRTLPGPQEAEGIHSPPLGFSTILFIMPRSQRAFQVDSFPVDKDVCTQTLSDGLQRAAPQAPGGLDCPFSLHPDVVILSKYKPKAKRTVEQRSCSPWARTACSSIRPNEQGTKISPAPFREIIAALV